MKKVIKSFFTSCFISCILMLYFLFLVFFIPRCNADEVLDINELSVSYRKYLPGGHNPLITENGLDKRELDKGLSLNLKTNFLYFMYWNNKVEGITDTSPLINVNGQFRSIGLETHFGINLEKHISLELSHHSQHVLDTTYPNHFPNEDSIGIIIYIVRPKSVDTLF